MTQNEALVLISMGNNVYLTGQAGSGKTFLLNKYIKFLKQHKIPVAVTASTGIAATHLNGITIHSWSGIGIKNNLSVKEINRLNLNSNKISAIQNARVLIIDEISMLHSYRLDMINTICKLARLNEKPFGGLQVILCGDFFQLPPIAEEGFEASSFAFKSAAWAELDLKICYIDEQHRQQDEEFLKVLSDIRSADLSENTYEIISSRLNEPLTDGILPTRLYCHNADVDAINNFELRKIDKPHHFFQMESSGNKELIKTLKKGCLAPEELVLKEGALVMFVKNNTAKGYTNGSLGTVTGFDDEANPIVRIYSGREIVASPASWKLDEDDKILAEISQIPLRLAWAITVHKSQGMSLDAAEIDLSKSFSYGMGYVALSRVKTLLGIRLLGINQMAFMVDEEISEKDLEFKNLSYQEEIRLKGLDKKEIRSAQNNFMQDILALNIENNKKMAKDFGRFFA
jgi:ATP-dependent exoDNAse (exonuclease V) alpha subunit